MTNLIKISFFIVAVFGGYFPVKYGMKHFVDTKLPQGYPSAGSVIGFLERSLFCICLVMDHVGLIGFILMIKAIYRFGDIQGTNEEKMKLSEYFIIGTFLSLTWMLIIWMIFLQFTSKY